MSKQSVIDKYPLLGVFLNAFPYKEEKVADRYDRANLKDDELTWFSNWIARVAKYKNVEHPILTKNPELALSLAKKVGAGDTSPEIRSELEKYFQSQGNPSVGDRPITPDDVFRRSEAHANYLLTRFCLQPLFTVIEYDKHGTALIQKLIEQRNMELSSSTIDELHHAHSLVQSRDSLIAYLNGEEKEEVMFSDDEEHEEDKDDEVVFSDEDLEEDRSDECEEKVEPTAQVYFDHISKKLSESRHVVDLEGSKRYLNDELLQFVVKQVSGVAVSLDINHCVSVTPAGFSYVKGLKTLKKLSLQGTGLSDKDLSSLELPLLEELDLSGTECTGDIQGLSTVKILSMSNCEVNMDALLRSFPNLTRLNLDYSVVINGEITNHTVTTISVCGTQEVVDLSPFKSLTHVAVSDSPNFPTPENNPEVTHLVGKRAKGIVTLQFDYLEEVVISGITITPEMVECMYNIEQITLSDCEGVTDELLEEISQMATVYLDISKNKTFTATGLSSLLSGQLEKLSVNECKQVNDDFIQVIKDATGPGLVSLDISMCEGITDKALQIIAQIPTLIKLRVRKCPKVTTAGIANLKRQRPEMVVKYR